MRITIDFTSTEITKEEAQPLFDLFNQNNTLEDGQLLEAMSFTTEKINNKINNLIQKMIDLGFDVRIEKE